MHRGHQVMGNNNKMTSILSYTVTAGILCALVPAANTDKMNVLFLVADDMRPQLGCYEGADYPTDVSPKMHTPNLDKLAMKSMLLKKAYVQQAVCSPSRTALLTGRRPDTSRVWDLVTYFRKSGGNFTTLPEYFKQNGYMTIGMGKIFHPGMAASGRDDPPSWNEPYFHAPNFRYWDNGNHPAFIPVSKEKIKEKPLPDMQIRDHAMQTLRKMAVKDQPFFVAVGFHKPHLPFVFPAEFLDYYPIDDIHIPSNMQVPQNMPDIAFNLCTGLHSFVNMRQYKMGINVTFPDNIVKQLRQSYYSAITYTDSLIGSVIDEIQDLGLSNNTIISFWGDHGWQLGEHSEWCKQTNFEQATHAPMMVHIPGMTDQGIHVEEITEFVDLFPTLVDAAGLPSIPTCPSDQEQSRKTELCTEGASLMPFVQPNEKNDNWKNVAFSQYPRKYDKSFNSLNPNTIMQMKSDTPTGHDTMGYTMRTSQYRYTEWVKFTFAGEFKADWNVLRGAELYDHANDPYENNNRAYDGEYQTIRRDLSKQLRKGWTGWQKGQRF